MVDFVGVSIVVVLGLVACILVVLVGWVSGNWLIREGLEIYEDILTKRSIIRDHEGRKKKS
jgi:hypothetical protein